MSPFKDYPRLSSKPRAETATALAPATICAAIQRSSAETPAERHANMPTGPLTVLTGQSDRSEGTSRPLRIDCGSEVSDSGVAVNDVRFACVVKRAFRIKAGHLHWVHFVFLSRLSSGSQTAKFCYRNCSRLHCRERGTSPSHPFHFDAADDDGSECDLSLPTRCQHTGTFLSSNLCT
jgi:hypothetical protein